MWSAVARHHASPLAEQLRDALVVVEFDLTKYLFAVVPVADDDQHGEQVRGLRIPLLIMHVDLEHVVVVPELAVLSAGHHQVCRGRVLLHTRLATAGLARGDELFQLCQPVSGNPTAWPKNPASTTLC